MQTSLAVVVMCIAFQQAGVLSLNDSMMLIYGANTGSSVLTMILASGLTGASRQVAMFQVSYNIAGAIIFVPLFYIEYYTGAPLVRHAVETITSNNATQLAIVNLIFNFVPGILLFALVSPLERLFKKLWPETAEEKASKPRYLHEQALEDPSGAFELIELEQVRLLEQLSAIFDLLRRQERRGNGRQLAAMTEAFSTLGKTIREAIGDVSIKHRLPSEGYEHLDLLLNLQHTMETALEEIIGFAESLEKLYTNEAGIKFAKIAIEGMDAILMILIEVARHRSPDDAEMLSIMTSEDGNGVSSVRSAYLSQQNDLDREGKMHLLSAANHCERLVWLFGDMGRHYMENSRF
jgi:phosphate:Na+ symporter